MRIVVTGGSGFIGSRLVEALTEEGHHVVGISRRSVSPRAAESHLREIESPEAQEAAAGGDYIVHLAGLSDASLSYGQPYLYNRVNAGGTLNMLEAARKSGAGFFLASTQRVYRPQRGPVSEDSPLQSIDPYGYSKVVAEKWVEMYHGLYGLKTTVGRFFSVYGIGQMAGKGLSGVAAIFVARALAGEDILIDSKTLRDFVFVDDVVQGIRLAIASPQAAGQTYNISTGVGTSLADLAGAVKEACGSDSRIVFSGEGGEGQNYIADLTKARRELGYSPKIDLRQGLRLYVDWMQAVRQGAVESAADQGAT